jgi:hypothetical protein
MAVKTDDGKKKFAMSYSFHLDTGDLARKTALIIQDKAEKAYDTTARYVRRRYRAMKVERTLHSMRKNLSKKIKLDLPIDLKALKSRVREVVHS